MPLRDRPRRKPPLYLGCLVVKHRGCWAADTTTYFPTITLEIAVTGYDVNSYELYVVIKPKHETFDEIMREKIASFINLHPLVSERGYGVIIVQTDEEMIMQLKIVDGGGPRGAIRPVVMFGAILTEICHHVEGGKEYVWGVFENSGAFEMCKMVAKMIYGENAIVESETRLSRSPGLTDGPKLFSEYALCGEVEFPELRAMIDQYLRQGTVSASNQESWPTEFYRKTKELIPKIAKVAERIAVAKELVELIRRILFPQIPPIDP